MGIEIRWRGRRGVTRVSPKFAKSYIIIILTFMWVLQCRRRLPRSSSSSSCIITAIGYCVLYETTSCRQVGRCTPLRLPVNSFLAHLSERNTKNEIINKLTTDTCGTAVYVRTRECVCIYIYNINILSSVKRIGKTSSLMGGGYNWDRNGRQTEKYGDGGTE